MWTVDSEAWGSNARFAVQRLQDYRDKYLLRTSVSLPKIVKNTISRVLVGSIRFSEAKYLGEWLAVMSTLKRYTHATCKQELSESEPAVCFRIPSCFLALLAFLLFSSPLFTSPLPASLFLRTQDSGL